ncbi:hypothetical protein ACIHFD_57095 [Nonomuraea sp. NPDC051941]|uniref:Rv1733c family protein n=1 Tax=Nonomuraea sp. NPDC051941 TaxID=3364373 RepID=UPI0037C65592
MKTSINPVTLRIRLYRLDRNPLRRRSDRLESAFVLVALFLVLASVWPAVLVGRLAYESALQDERVGAGSSRQVMATLLEDVPVARVSLTKVPVAEQVALARWTTPEGQARSGQVPAPALAKAGSVVPVWIDASGAPASSPLDLEVLRMRGVATGLLIVLLTTMLTLATLAGLRWRMDRNRYKEWDTGWACADKAWRRRRQT